MTKPTNRVALAFLIGLMACSPGYSPDVYVVCVQDDSGIEKLEEIFAGVAEANGLEFLTGGAEIQELLERSGNVEIGDYPFRTFHAHDLDRGIELTGSNQFMTEHQFAVSRDRRRNQALVSEELFAEIERQFDVYPAEEGKGAMPVETCSN